MDLLTIDGSEGEGGGQVLRSALSLSLVTGRPFRIVRIRARRRKPGLRRQHLTAVLAAAAVGRATVTGGALGSQELTFTPNGVIPGAHRFVVGSSGSAILVLQTVLPALLCAPAPSRVVLEGGTHNPLAPPYDFLERAYLPIVARMGPEVRARLERHGFHPAGGGRFAVEVAPAPALAPFTLLERGALRTRRARCLLAGLPGHIAGRELETVAARLGWPAEALERELLPPDRGPGNALLLEVESEAVTEVFSGVGRKGVPAERVAGEACAEVEEYLEAGVPVGRHLADQLLILAALAGGGRYRTLSPSEHLRTQVAVIRAFLPVAISVRAAEGAAWEVEVAG